MREGAVHRREIALHDVLALAAIGLADGFLDPRDRLVARQHAGDGEEAGLQDGVGAPAQPDLLGGAGGIDHEQLQAEVADARLHRPWQMLP